MVFFIWSCILEEMEITNDHLNEKFTKSKFPITWVFRELADGILSLLWAEYPGKWWCEIKSHTPTIFKDIANLIFLNF